MKTSECACEERESCKEKGRRSPDGGGERGARLGVGERERRRKASERAGEMLMLCRVGMQRD